MLILASPSSVPKRADEARLVLVGDVEHVRAELGLELMPLIWMSARLAVGEDGAGDRALLPLGLDRERI